MHNMSSNSVPRYVVLESFPAIASGSGSFLYGVINDSVAGMITTLLIYCSD